MSYENLLKELFTPGHESPLNFKDLCKTLYEKDLCGIEDFGYNLSEALLEHAALSDEHRYTIWVLLRDIITDELEAQGHKIPQPEEN